MPANDLEVRVWRFADFEFDEASYQLKAHGTPVSLEMKPLEILHQLLERAGEVVSKDELLEGVWPGLTVVDGSLATAVSKLRKALGDEDQAIILTVPRVGYRLATPVQWRRVPPPAMPELGFAVGDAVPGRDQWKLIRRMDLSGSSEVWLGEHPKTREQRVFKFAADPVRLKGLKREVTIARLLKEALPGAACFVRLLEWNFDTPPYRLESEYGGTDLDEWAAVSGGLGAIPWSERLRVFLAVGRGVATAHGVGVLHKDLKPGNLLIDAAGQVRVADFGSGAMTDAERLQALGITNLGFTATETNPLTGTLLYLPPEVLAGQPSSARSDVYALGVMLFQFAAGDFRRPLAPGWEADIADPLLREDIAEAAAGDPAKRLSSVAALVERLESLEARRVARGELEQTRLRAAAAEATLARARARRPWVIAAVLALALGLAASLVLYRNATRQTAIAAKVNQFLATSLLGRGNPFRSGKSGETLLEAVAAAAPDIDRRFGDEPEVAARLHQAIAKALDNRSHFAEARREYTRAAELFDRSAPPEAIATRLQLAAMEARTYAEGSLAAAKKLLVDQEARLAGVTATPDTPVWLASARGMIALIENNAKAAAAEFEKAYTLSTGFDLAERLTLKQRLAFSQIRLGNGPRAEQLFRELIGEFGQLQGPESPSVLRVRLNLAQAFMIQNKHREAVAETTAIYPAYVKSLGEDHELAMQVLTTRAQSAGSLGDWDSAIADDLKIHALAVKKQGELSFFALATLSDGALAQCRAGRLAEGAANARKAYDGSAKAFGARAGLTGGTAYALASCLILQRSFDEPQRLLAAIDVPAVAQLAGVQDWGANVELSLGQIAHARGDQAGALKHLDAAAPVLTRADAEPYQRKAVAELRAALGR